MDTPKAFTVEWDLREDAYTVKKYSGDPGHIPKEGLGIAVIKDKYRTVIKATTPAISLADAMVAFSQKQKEIEVNTERDVVKAIVALADVIGEYICRDQSPNDIQILLRGSLRNIKESVQRRK